MQTPTGYEIIDGRFFPTNWFEVVFNPSFPFRLAHTVTGFFVTICLWSWWRRPRAGGKDKNQGRQSLPEGHGDHGLLQERQHLENAHAMANHSSRRTTKLHDRRTDELSLDEYERVGIWLPQSMPASGMISCSFRKV